jgi:hypothetical protein
VKTRTLEWISSALEIATGVALIALPDAVARLLLGTSFTESGTAVARLTGCALLSLGLACLPSGEPMPNATRALFVYNLLAGLYLGYLRVGGGFAGILLWPACALHVLFAILLLRPAIATVSK